MQCSEGDVCADRGCLGGVKGLCLSEGGEARWGSMDEDVCFGAIGWGKAASMR